ncbi:hypothetical protein HQ571_01350 [Candidatus Kuenenbacteria bacterium]|nr:hypothetical protein [Candidatus Kuenenbacteria bacterium]
MKFGIQDRQDGGSDCISLGGGIPVPIPTRFTDEITVETAAEVWQKILKAAEDFGEISGSFTEEQIAQVLGFLNLKLSDFVRQFGEHFEIFYAIHDDYDPGGIFYRICHDVNAVLKRIGRDDLRD